MFCQVNLLNFENPAEIMGLFQNPLKFLQQTSISESSARVPERGDLSLEHSATFTSRSKQREVQQEKSSLNDITVKIITQYGPTSMRNWRQEQKSIQRVLCSSLQQLSHKDAHVLAIHCREEPISAPKWSISNGFHKLHVYLTTTRHCPGSQNNFPLVMSNPCFVLTVEWVTNVKLSLWLSLFNWATLAFLKLWKLEGKQHYLKTSLFKYLNKALYS